MDGIRNKLDDIRMDSGCVDGVVMRLSWVAFE